MITREQTQAFRLALPLAPEAQIERKVEGDWAYRDGMRWFQGRVWVGEHVADLTFVYDGRRSFQNEALLHGSRMRGTIFGGESPQEPCPLDFGWLVERRPIGAVLRRGDFRIAGRRTDPRHGSLVRIEGREWPARSDARTVVLLAEERGFLPVRVERYLPKSRTPLTVMETVAAERVGDIWFPVAVRQESRYAGTQATELTATDVHVNDVAASRFRVAWTRPGWVFDNTTNTALVIGNGGRLALDPRSSRLPPNRLVAARMAVTLVVFVGLSLAVVSAVRMLRRKVGPHTPQSDRRSLTGGS